MNRTESSRRKQQSAKDKKLSIQVKIGDKPRKTNRNSNYVAPIMKYKNIRPAFETNMSNGRLTVKGTDYIGLSSGGSIAGYANLFNYMISPLSGTFGGTRLANFALNYEKYIFKRMTFHIQSATPTTTGGSYVVGFDRDVSDNLPPLTEIGVQTLMANQSSNTGAISESIDLEVRLADNQDFYYTNYTGNEPRLAYQGRIVGMNTTPVTSNFSLCIWVSYEIVFMNPALESQEYCGVGQVSPYSLGVGKVSYPVAIMTGAKAGDDFVRRSFNSPYISGSGQSIASNTPTPTGISVPSGYYEVQTTLCVNSNDKRSSVTQLLGQVENITNGVKGVVSTINSIRDTMTSIVNVVDQLLPGYQLLVDSNAVNMLCQWYVYIPPGGGLLYYILYQGAGDVAGAILSVSKPLALTIRRISRQSYSNSLGF